MIKVEFYLETFLNYSATFFFTNNNIICVNDRFIQLSLHPACFLLTSVQKNKKLKYFVKSNMPLIKCYMMKRSHFQILLLLSLLYYYWQGQPLIDVIFCISCYVVLFIHIAVLGLQSIELAMNLRCSRYFRNSFIRNHFFRQSDDSYFNFGTYIPK